MDKSMYESVSIPRRKTCAFLGLSRNGEPIICLAEQCMFWNTGWKTCQINVLTNFVIAIQNDLEEKESE